MLSDSDFATIKKLYDGRCPPQNPRDRDNCRRMITAIDELRRDAASYRAADPSNFQRAVLDLYRRQQHPGLLRSMIRELLEDAGLLSMDGVRPLTLGEKRAGRTFTDR